jgi:hypothetical protein
MQSGPTTEAVNSWFASYCGEAFDLVLAGNVFGGRYGESPQHVKCAALKGDTLRISFNTTETLTVLGPRDVVLGSNGLSIREVKELEFGWHSYGKEEKPENWKTIRLRSNGESVVVQTITFGQVETESTVSLPKYAVQLVRNDA